jgi:iron complex outermembrane receptor protein
MRLVRFGITFAWACAGAEEIHELAPITVSATRAENPFATVPYSIGYAAKEEIQRANRQLTLAETLEGVPGVFIQNPWNFAQDTRIAIRGFGARADFGIRGIRLLVDGLPATTPDGQGEVDGLDLGSAARIEVLRGPGAAFYGAASGGVILVKTEDPPSRPFTEGRLTLGEDRFRHWQAKLGGTSGDIGYLLSGGYLETDGYREHSETENRKLNGKVDWRVSSQDKLRLVFNVIDYPLQNDPGGLTREEAAADPRQARERNLLYDGGERVEQQRLGVQYERTLDSERRLKVSLHSTWRDFANKLPFEAGGQVAYDRRFYGARFQYGLDMDRIRVRVGADLDVQEDDRRNYDNVQGERGELALHQDEDVRSGGLYTVFQYEAGERVDLSAALRFDEVVFDVEDRYLADGNDGGERTFREWSPSVGLSWRTAPGLVLFGNASTAFETPTTTEFDNPDGGGFNPDLGAQQSRSIEAGIRGTAEKEDLVLTLQASAFRIDIEDALVPYELEEFPGREFFRNAGESRRNGLELAMALQFSRVFTVEADYTWSDFHYTRFDAPGGDFSENHIPGIPRHFGGVRLEYEPPGGFFALWQTRFVGAMQANDANSSRVDGYIVSDLRIGFRGMSGAWEWEPFLGLDNVFNKDYFANIRINAFGGRYFEPAPDRRVFLGIRVRYAPQ